MTGKRGSIALARSICYEVAGPTDEDDDISGSGYGSVDIAEILSAEVERLREEVESLAAAFTEKNVDRKCENRKLRETLRDKFFCAALTGIFASESDEVYTRTEVVEIAWEIANIAIETRGI